MAIWHVDVVTGLFQTEAYARHIISSYSRVEPIAPGMIGRLVRVRMQRQQVLNREGLQLSVVFDARRVDSGFQQIIHVPAIGRLVLQFGQSGEVAILCRYLHELVSVRLTYLEPRPGFKWSRPPENNYIDALVYDKLKQALLQG